MKRKDAYLGAMQEVMTDNSPAKPTLRPLEELEIDLTAVTKRLQGPLHNVERVWLVEDKRALQKQIAAARGC